MGETAELMIEGVLCQWCGVYLEQNDKVYQEGMNEGIEKKYVSGIPLICKDCFPTIAFKND